MDWTPERGTLLGQVQADDAGRNATVPSIAIAKHAMFRLGKVHVSYFALSSRIEPPGERMWLTRTATVLIWNDPSRRAVG